MFWLSKLHSGLLLQRSCVAADLSNTAHCNMVHHKACLQFASVSVCSHPTCTSAVPVRHGYCRFSITLNPIMHNLDHHVQRHRTALMPEGKAQKSSQAGC